MVTSAPIKDIETINQIKNLYSAKKEFTHLLLFMLAINTGANLKELLKLKIKDVKNKQFITFDNKKAIPLNDEIKQLVQKITTQKGIDKPLFVNTKNKPLDRTTVFYRFKEICKELALDENINVSSWRKTFGYFYYEKYRDLSFLQWYFSQNGVEETMNFIGIDENMNLRFKEGVCL